jgi:hypothetical protein
MPLSLCPVEFKTEDTAGYTFMIPCMHDHLEEFVTGIFEKPLLIYSHAVQVFQTAHALALDDLEKSQSSVTVTDFARFLG